MEYELEPEVELSKEIELNGSNLELYLKPKLQSLMEYDLEPWLRSKLKP